MGVKAEIGIVAYAITTFSGIGILVLGFFLTLAYFASAKAPIFVAMMKALVSWFVVSFFIQEYCLAYARHSKPVIGVFEE